MWTDLFNRSTSHVPDRSVDRVDRVDDKPMPVSTAPLAGVAADPNVVAECVDRVDASKIAPVDTTSRPPLAATASGVVSGMSPRTVMPSVSVSDCSTPSTQSTQSTQSTPGKCCRLLTVAEKDALLALFEADIALVEMEAGVLGHEPANELRRVINVVWRLMTVEGWDFDTAATAAAEWVVAQPMHPDELSFADVLAFSRGRDEK